MDMVQRPPNLSVTAQRQQKMVVKSSDKWFTLECGVYVLTSGVLSYMILDNLLSLSRPWFPHPNVGIIMVATGFVMRLK